MLVNNNNPAQQIKAVEETSKKKTISKTDAKVSKLAKGFFASIGACIAAPFKFCAKMMKSGFLALISLFKKENKNNPSAEKKGETPSAPAAEPAKKLVDKEVQTDTQVAEQAVQTDTQVAEQAVQVDKQVAEQAVQVDKQVAEQAVQVDKQVAEQAVQVDTQEVEQAVETDTQEVEQEVQDNQDYERLNSLAALVGLAGFFIPMTVNTFTASYKGDTFANVSLPVCYANESLAFGK